VLKYSLIIYNIIKKAAYFAHCGLRVIILDLKLHDIVIMKKPHPCGSKEFEVLRLGVDYKLKCLGCGREVMVPRIKAQKSIKAVKENGNG